MTITLSSLVYAITVGILFYTLRGELRVPLLTLASVGYAFFLNRKAGFILLITILLTWLIGLLIGTLRRKNRRKALFAVTGIGVALAALTLVLLKYLPGILEGRGVTEGPFVRLIVPIGFSFYIFQTISYFTDLSRGDAAPMRNPFHLALYLAWFPRFISGPIERANPFAEELNGIMRVRLRDAQRWKQVLHFLTIGVFMKLVIADRLGIVVDYLFEHHIGFGATFLLLGILFYTIQIYCDFAGYSYVALGLSLAFGIRLTENFLMPYCSANITEFWRRWHRSLSTWLKDYLYIPLGGNRLGTGRKILNTMIVFVICGAWHGYGWTFIIWGALHGVYSAVDALFREKGIRWIRSGISGRILTFLAVAFAWIFFRADSLATVKGYLQTMAEQGLRLHSFAAEAEVLHLGPVEWSVIALSVLTVLLLDAFAYRKRMSVPKMTAQMRPVFRYILLFVLLSATIIFGMYGPAYDSNPMIYMQF
ncbi:MAG: MBOAT family protein [Lachnospiraceae bacterium]|nr:MBOAT family protein [Lachnospiraceae bacterium]